MSTNRDPFTAYALSWPGSQWTDWCVVPGPALVLLTVIPPEERAWWIFACGVLGGLVGTRVLVFGITRFAPRRSGDDPPRDDGSTDVAG